VTAESSPCALGLDVGGTKTAGGLVDMASGHLLARRVIPTEPWRGGQAVLTDALQLAEGLMAEAVSQNRAVAGLGVSVCELVDREGNVTSGQTVAWADLPVREAFSRLAPAVIEADVRAHARAEAMWGAGCGYRQFVFVAVGTGISSCLVLDGRPYAGARGQALVLASSPLVVPCPACGNTRWPALEEFASGPALVARYNARGGHTVARAEAVVAAAVAGDAAAGQVIQSAGQALGVSLGWLVNVLDPEVLIVGGGLGSAGGRYWDSVVESTRAHIWSAASRDLPIRPARLGPEAAVVGAALAGARLEHDGYPANRFDADV
jgi:glucokinase